MTDREKYPLLTNLRFRFTRAFAQLEEMGYEHTYTVMTDGNAGTDYGRVFIHPTRPKFYLNSETLDSLPDRLDETGNVPSEDCEEPASDFYARLAAHIAKRLNTEPENSPVNNSASDSPAEF
jgi:hypothetical protein